MAPTPLESKLPADEADIMSVERRAGYIGAWFAASFPKVFGFKLEISATTTMCYRTDLPKHPSARTNPIRRKP